MPFEFYFDGKRTHFRDVPVTEYTQQGQQSGQSQQGGPSQPQAGPFQQMPQAAPEHPRDQVPEYQPPPQREEKTSNPERDTSSGMLTRDEVDRIIAERLEERDRAHAEEVARLQAQVPQLVVPAHGGGPGNDNHQRSWNLAEQERARAGEHLDHWHD